MASQSETCDGLQIGTQKLQVDAPQKKKKKKKKKDEIVKEKKPGIKKKRKKRKYGEM